MGRVTSDSRIVDSDGNVQKVGVLIGYENADIDESGSPAYYGFKDSTGRWYIRKIDTGHSTYAIGSSGYTTSWTGRAGLTYAEFDDAF